MEVSLQQRNEAINSFLEKSFHVRISWLSQHIKLCIEFYTLAYIFNQPELSGSTGTGMLLDEDIALLAVESSAALEEPRTSTGWTAELPVKTKTHFVTSDVE